MRVSKQSASELGLSIENLHGVTKRVITLEDCPRPNYTKEHLFSVAIQQLREEGDDNTILVDIEVAYENSMHGRGYSAIIVTGDLYHLT